MRKAAFAIVFLLLAGPAAAHPHAWMTAGAAFVFEAGRVAALDITWSMDKATSEVLLVDFDTDGDGTINAAEQAVLTDVVFTGLDEIGYFTFVRVGDELQQLTADRFSAVVENGSVIYRFRVHLTEAVDPAAAPVAVGLYDEEFYIQIDYTEADISLTGPGSETCRAQLAPDEDHKIYFDMVVPQKIELVCTP